MRTGALTIALAALAGCQIIGGIEERSFADDAGIAATPADAGAGDAEPHDAAAACTGTACTHDVALGASFSCAREVDGRVRCWGANARGQLGDGTIDDRKDPVFVHEVSDATDVWAGTEHACARLADGRAACWGSNVQGELGDVELRAFYRARGGVVPGLDGVLELAPGDLHTCARTASGVVCWGGNVHGECGPGLDEKVAAPAAVAGLDGDVAGIAAGGFTTCAWKNDGTVMCWGDNASGQLANGKRGANAEPRAVAELGPAVHVGMSDDRVCAVLRDGTVWCWGGSPAAADAGPPPPPAKVDGVARAVRVELGAEHTCARLDDATLTCWGYDLHGQLGRDRKDGGAPGVVPSFPEVTSFELGSAHTCARSNGVLHCWGLNDRGQLGEGSTTDQYEPVKVLAP